MVKHRSLYFWKILKNRKGFTMTEVVVVLSLIGIIMAISVPSFISWLPKHRLETSARQIYDDMNLARIRAIKNNTVAGIACDIAAETYTVYLDVDGNLGYAPGVDTIIKLNVTLENGIDITVANVCEFNNRGMFTAGPGQVSLTSPTGLVMNVNVNTAGNISVS